MMANIEKYINTEKIDEYNRTVLDAVNEAGKTITYQEALKIIIDAQSKKC